MSTTFLRNNFKLTSLPFPPSMVLGRLVYGLAGAVGLYAALLGVLLTPNFQRFALYAHRVNTLFWHDLNDSEQFGFAKNQVTAFTLETPDGEKLFAWHVLPIDVYARHEHELQTGVRQTGPVQDFTSTPAFRLLSQGDQEPAKVVISFHGNAGHIAQGWRADAHRSITTQPNTHVFTLDYRGFGHSSGSPSEAGLITDGTALINFVMQECGIPAENIVILGQSLGTAVSSAMALRFADPSNALIPPLPGQDEQKQQSTIFAGVVLVAPFANIPSLLLTYRMGGLIPLLGPLRPFPVVGRFLTAKMVDQWRSEDRLAAYYDHLTRKGLVPDGERGRGSLQVLHALNDADITCHQSEMICSRVFDKSTWGRGVECIDSSKGPGLVEVNKKGSPYVRFEMLSSGGHNKIIMSAPVSVAVMRAFANQGELTSS